MDYNAKHKRKDVVGICGVSTTYWGDLLKENGVKVNSLKACLVIYKELLNKHKNKRATIKAYKGIETKSNMWIVDKTIEIERKMK